MRSNAAALRKNQIIVEAVQKDEHEQKQKNAQNNQKLLAENIKKQLLLARFNLFILKIYFNSFLIVILKALNLISMIYDSD